MRLILNVFYLFDFQDAQVTIECVIPQKFHRSIMGPKGSRIQQITRDHIVQIKFPEREDPQGKAMDIFKTWECCLLTFYSVHFIFLTKLSHSLL